MYNICFKGNINKKKYDDEYLPKNALVISPKESSLINGNIFSCALILIMIIITLYKFFTSNPILDHSVVELLIYILIGLVFLIPVFILHELLHAICFPKKAKKEIWYEFNSKSLFLFSFQVYSNTLIKRNTFLLMLLLPNVILSFVPLIFWYTGIISFTPFSSRIIGAILTILFTCGASDYSLFFDTLCHTKKHDYIIMYHNKFYKTIDKV